MITDVSGIRVGHWTDQEAKTGCTVVLCPPGTVGSGEVRGGAPGTRETDLLRPGMSVQTVDAVVLSGGSAYGLSAADGVMRWLEEAGRGLETGPGIRVPIVPAAVLYDLDSGESSIRPGPDQGREACENAKDTVALGKVGAGTGAMVARLRGPGRAVPGGLGGASEEKGGVVLAALAAVNAVGEVFDADGTLLAGALEGDDEEVVWPPAGTNTTLVVIATNAILSKERANLLAIAAHEGIDAAVRPAHTAWDGDTVFTLATGERDAKQTDLEEMAIRVTAEAIRDAVR